MKAIQMTSKSILWTLVVPSLMAIAQPAAAELYELHAATTTIKMDDGTEVPMWGFGLGTEGAVSIPGPVLDVPPGDDTLTINLTNQLPVAVSIVIPAIPAPLTPLWMMEPQALAPTCNKGPYRSRTSLSPARR